MSDHWSAQSYEHTDHREPAQDAELLEAMLILDGADLSMYHPVPTIPGFYRDHAGDPWILSTEGQWFDKHGTTKPITWNPLLIVMRLRKAN